MRKYRACLALAIFMLLCSGCAGGSLQPTLNTTSPTAIVNSPVPTSTPMATEIATTVPSPTVPEDTFKFNEENFTQYFQFGMSQQEVRIKLETLGIKITNESIIVSDYPEGFWEIDTDDCWFYFNSKNQLYMIGASGWETAKGLNAGDSLDRMRQLYGLEDDYNDYPDGYVYYKEDYMLSFSTDYQDESKIAGWGVFVNTWNYPDILTGDTKNLTGDALIKFNENNYNKYFNFDMNRQDVRNRLTNLGVRIILEQDITYLDNGYMEIDTDHISFSFDEDTDKLTCISFNGWETAKGLKEGDSLDKLHLLYGKENEAQEDVYYFITNKCGLGVFTAEGKVHRWWIYQK